MEATPMTSTRLGKWRSAPHLAGFVIDPLMMTRRLHREHGPFVVLDYPLSTRGRPAMMGCIADSALYQTMVIAPEIWRNVNINFRGPKNHASRRLTVGMTRLRGARHAHYRKILTPPLRRPAVMAMSPAMAATAAEQTAAWPRDRALDLLPLTENLMQYLAIGLLFGDDVERAVPIAKMIARQVDASYPVPGRAFLSWYRIAAKQERAILEWAEQKRGEIDPRDILSIIANNLDEQGQPPSPEIIGGILTFTFGAAYETCQNGLIWTLIMLTQHPRIASDLADEIRGALRGAAPTMDLIGELPLLDAVMREGLRLFPPVPLTFRRSVIDTALGDTPFKAGTRVLISTHIINRNPDLYPQPDQFRPERWSSVNPSPFNYATFGAGGHMCPGVTFAHQMMKSAMAAILSRFRIEMTAEAKIDYRLRVTLGPHPGVPVILRDAASAPVTRPIRGGVHRLVDLTRAA